MHPQEIAVNLSLDDHRQLLGELTLDNRALRLVVAKYVERYGVLEELDATPKPPEAPVPAEATEE